MREEPEQTSLSALKVDSSTGSHTQLIRKAARSGSETILTSDRKLFAGHLMGHALAQRKGQLENKVDLRRITPTYIRALLGLVYNELHHGSRAPRDIPLTCTLTLELIARAMHADLQIQYDVFLCLYTFASAPQQPPLDYNYNYI